MSTLSAPSPLGYINAIPVFRSGQADARLRSRTQLKGARLRPAPGQLPAAYVLPRYHPDTPCRLYDPAAAEPLPAPNLGTRWAMRIRRTCPRCGRVGEHIVRRGRCEPCALAEAERRAQAAARTCGSCRRVGRAPYRREPCYPYRPLCGRCFPAAGRRRREALARALTCPGMPGRECGSVTAARWELGAAAAWARRRCPACATGQAVLEARVRREAAERARREDAARDAQVRELAAWAAVALADPNLRVLDTETTGLGADARIIEVAVTDAHKNVVFETLIDPGEPIPAEASAIHGITDAMVAGRPCFAAVLPALTAVLAGRRVLIYNKGFDIGRLAHELERGGLEPGAWLARFTAEDTMEPYSAWVGEVDEYRGGWRRQRLNGGHRAAGDCLAVLDRLALMAGGTC